MSESASATMSYVQLDPTTYQYTITLTDTGSTTIGTFWFAWTPEINLMDTAPIEPPGSPDGWYGNVTNKYGGDGIMWQPSVQSSAMQPGQTLSGFSFVCTDTPATLLGESLYATDDTVSTSTIYSGEPFSDNGASFVVTLACFREGTRIQTARGPVTVEALAIGDRVPVLKGGASRAITWLGCRHVDCRDHPDPERVWPVLVRAQALGPGWPISDLYLSPDHALYLGGVLIPVHALINGRTILREPCEEVTYWHVELAEHDVLFAEGAPAESYLDTGNRGAFANGRPIAREVTMTGAYRRQREGRKILAV